MTAATPTIPRMPRSRRHTGEPLYAYELTAEHKHEFINLIYEGHRADSAAHAIGSTGTQFKRLQNPRAQYYDADFAQAVRAALDSAEHKRNQDERIRDLADQRAETSDRILEKRMFTLPEYENQRHQNFVNIQFVIQRSIDPDPPQHIIEKLIEAHELLEAWRQQRAVAQPERLALTQTTNGND